MAIKMRNVSSTSEEAYMTLDGNVIVRRTGPRTWSLLVAGFTGAIPVAGSKADAFALAKTESDKVDEWLRDVRGKAAASRSVRKRGRYGGVRPGGRRDV